MTSSQLQSNSNRGTVTAATHQVHTDAAMYKATLQECGFRQFINIYSHMLKYVTE